MGGMDMTQRLRILPKTGELGQQLMMLEIDHHRRGFATPYDDYAFTVSNVVE